MSYGLPGWVSKRLDPAERYGLRASLLAIATLLVMVPFSFLLVQVTTDGPMTRIDTEVANEIHEEVLESPVLEPVLTVISFVGSPLAMYIAAGLGALFFLRRGQGRIALYLVVTNLFGGAINSLLKIIVDRPRPDLPDPIGSAHGYSFPSGHSVGVTVGVGSLLLAFMPLIPRPWRPVAVAGYVAAVVAVAGSRLGLVVHYFSDVLAGIILGLAWLALSTAAFSIWRTERGRPPVDLGEGLEPEAG